MLSVMFLGGSGPSESLILDAGDGVLSCVDDVGLRLSPGPDIGVISSCVFTGLVVGLVVDSISLVL